ncbi:MAG: putative membrane protein [Flavobacteriaceae bacterium]|jgi:putative membrane protein
MKFIIKLLLTAVAVILLAKVLPGVEVVSYSYAILVALVIGFLKVIVKPILVVLTLPVTIITFGLFLLVINAIIILLADSFLSGFIVDGLGWALLFSLLLSFLQSILRSLIKEEKK